MAIPARLHVTRRAAQSNNDCYVILKAESGRDALLQGRALPMIEQGATDKHVRQDDVSSRANYHRAAEFSQS